MVSTSSTEDVDLARDVDACCRLSGEFTLRSGQIASEYFDKYLFEADPVLLARVVAQMVDLVPAGTELLGGLELGGVPIATVLSARTGLPALFVRKQAKQYGTCKLAEGQEVAGRRVTLVEDVITTGGAVRDATRALREAGAVVETVVCAIDRSPEGENPLADVGLEVRPVLHQGAAGRRARVVRESFPCGARSGLPSPPSPLWSWRRSACGASTTRRRPGSPRTRGSR
jgi:orotate phosphoribosyltransferase